MNSNKNTNKDILIKIHKQKSTIFLPNILDKW